jgi:hypothetical protein
MATEMDGYRDGWYEGHGMAERDGWFEGDDWFEGDG